MTRYVIRSHDCEYLRRYTPDTSAVWGSRDDVIRYDTQAEPLGIIATWVYGGARVEPIDDADAVPIVPIVPIVLESDADVGARIASSHSVNGAGEALILAGIRAARHADAVWCRKRAACAQREATSVPGSYREHRCDGQADAYTAAAMAFDDASRC